MTPRLSLLALLLLAACSEPRPAADAASVQDSGATASAAASAQPSARNEPELPDFGDPRAFLDLRLDSARWAAWETQPPGGRDARLRALGIVPIRSDGYGEEAADYHFVEFSGDGVADVIYDGGWYGMRDGSFAALEGGHLKLYQVFGDSAHEVLDSYGSLQRVWPGAAGEPASLRMIHQGCCGDTYLGAEYLRPVRIGDTVRYQAFRRVDATYAMRMPERLMDAPRRFTVRNEGYLLRTTPAIVTAEVEDGWQGHGNALAVYGRGARGIALAEQADSTGRVWWFVKMDGRTPPTATMTEEDTENPVTTDRLGWMSSRFVDVQP
jgi:hypothetical protein